MASKLYNAEKGAELLQAKRLVIHRFDLTEAQWSEMMVDVGCRFAESFSRLFPNSKTVQDILLKEKSEDGLNTYWQWWQYKWMQEDMGIVKSCIYYEDINYQDWKEQMIGEEILETDLLATMEGKIFIKS
jgi:hypothetical protein